MPSLLCPSSCFCLPAHLAPLLETFCMESDLFQEFPDYAMTLQGQMLHGMFLCTFLCVNCDAVLA